MISKDALEKFKALYKSHFNIDLTDQEALDKGTRLMSLIKTVSQAIAEEEYDTVQKRRPETGGA